MASFRWLLFAWLSSFLALRLECSAATFTVSNTNDSGSGSFRQAILDANTNIGKDTIAFTLPGSGPFTISPGAGGLPAITDPVSIDATTQTGYSGTPLVEVTGTNSGGGSHGFRILSGDTLIRGFTINKFTGYGISIEGGASNMVRGNFIGTDRTGTTNKGNSTGGILLFRSAGNVIGGLNAGDRNVISGTNNVGVVILDASSSNNVVAGNFVGTDPTGTLRRGNTLNGVLISDARNNIIGGTSPAARNVISGNGQSGVYLLGNASGNIVSGNYIGTDVSGTLSLSNVVDGVTIYGAASNTVGGIDASAANVISGNFERGIFLSGGARQNSVSYNRIGTDVTGRAALGNGFAGVGISGASNNLIGIGNIISGNKQSGVAIGTNSPGNIVQGNFIGLDITGTNALTNLFYGVNINSSPNNVIGGTNAAARNVISGNLRTGIYISGTNTAGNTVLGNFIGTSASGKTSIANADGGVRIDAPGNIIGGKSAESRNVISGNTRNGVYIFGSIAASNIVSGNFVGVDADGTNALGNSAAGIGITNAPFNTIGGTNAGERNIVSGNADSGVSIGGSNATGNRLLGNFIGTDVTGTAAIPNQIGGVGIYGAPTNFIGGTTSGAGNLISGNKAVGVAIGDAGGNGNRVQGNFIGTKADGLSPLGNEWHGVEILNTSSNNFIGGTAPGAGNRIAYAVTAAAGGYDGIRIRDGCTRNYLRLNSFFGNAGLGIDLSTNGVSANDAGDADSGANNLQNFPVLASASGRYVTTIQGTLNSAASTTFTIDFYASPSQDSTTYGEGQKWIGETTVTTAANGNAAFTVTFTNVTGVWPYISSIATDPQNNTSEFSKCALASLNTTDADNDGMPDEFEQAAHLSPTNPNDAASDLDGDGFSNLREYLAGTDPNDASDYLRIDNFRKVNQSTTFTFASLIGKTYSVEFSTNLVAGWNGLTGATNLAGTGLTINITDNNAGTREKYYRIRVP